MPRHGGRDSMHVRSRRPASARGRIWGRRMATLRHLHYRNAVLAVAFVAALLFPGTSLARVHNATGSVSFSDSHPSFSTNLSDRLTVSVSNIFADPGRSYYAWLSSDDQSSFLALGTIELDGSGGGTLTYTSPSGGNLIEGYNGFWISSENPNTVSGQPDGGSIKMSDVIAPAAMDHIRRVVGAWPPGSDGKGLAVGAREQIDIAQYHAVLSAEAPALSDIHSHAHHVINIAEGSSGDNYDVSSGDPGEVTSIGCVNDIRRRPSQPLIQWRFHPHTVHRDRRLRSTQGPSDA